MPGEGTPLLVLAPTMSVQTTPSARQDRNFAPIISAISNLSIQYNFAAIAVALAFMDNDDREIKAAYPRTDEQSSYIKSLVFAGAIVGQFTMGIAGDLLGRRNAMLLTNSFSAVGALGTALLTWGTPSSIYATMGACRFLLGVGVGGKYPLAATMSHESSPITHTAASPAGGTQAVAGSAAGSTGAIQVAKGFFWQTPGAMLPYVVGIILLSIMGQEHYGASFRGSSSFAFRLVLGVGALPTLVAMVLTYRTAESEEFQAVRAEARHPCRVLRAHPELLGRLAGCGLSWGLYDFVYYGTSFNQVVITDEVFGKGEALFDNFWQNIVLTAMGLPGVVLAIGALLRWSSLRLQGIGFAALVLSCVALALAVSLDATERVKFALFCVLVFSLNWGPNVSTYCLPAEVFPTAVRSSCFGLSAAMGKLGALIGSASFKAILGAVGLDGVYYICAGVSLVGVLVTVVLIPLPTATQGNRLLGSATPAPGSIAQQHLLPEGQDAPLRI